MSLVNDMLRDLEKRNEGAAQIPGQSDSVKAAHPSSSAVQLVNDGKKARIALWLIGLSALLLTGWFLWQDQAIKQEPNLAKAIPASSAKLIPAAAKVKPSELISEEIQVVAGNEITQIQWNEHTDGGNLVITLNQASDVQLVSQDEQSISLGLLQTTLGTTVPQLEGSLIKRLDMIRETDRILINLLAKTPSRFNFSVQQTPSALIIGIQPSVVGVKGGVQASSDQDPVVQGVAEKKEVVQEQASTKVKLPDADSVITGGAVQQVNSLQVNAEQKAIIKPTQPVVKVTNTLTETKVLSRAKRLLKQGQTSAAQALLQQRISDYQNNSLKSRQLLVSILLSAGNEITASELLQKSLQLHPQDLVLKKLFVRSLLAKGKNEESIKLLTKSPPLLAKDPEYFELLASAYQYNGQPDQSASVYYQLLQLDSSQPRWWIGLGYSLEQAQRYQEARKAYQSGLQVPSIDSQLKNYARQRSSALAGH